MAGGNKRRLILSHTINKGNILFRVCQIDKHIKFDIMKVEIIIKFIPMSSEIYKRTLVEQIKKWLDRPEIMVIIGPRQVGKTFLVRDILPKITSRQIEYFNFEDLEVRGLFISNPKSFLTHINDKDKIYVFDEFQKAPELTDYLKLKYDQGKEKMPKIFLTGSSSFKIQDKIAESLVGQSIIFNLFSLSFIEKYNLEKFDFLADLSKLNITELKQNIFFKGTELKNKLNSYLLEGGYPELGELSTQQKWEKLKSIIQTVLEKDLQNIVKADHLFSAKKLLEILSYRIGQIVSFENLASEMQLNIKTIRNLASILEGLFFIEFIYPKSSFGNEYKKAPKVYFDDLGMRNELIKIRNLPLEKTQIGCLVENFIFNQLKRYSFYKNDFRINYWQDYNKNEVDFILNQDNEIISLEVKYRKFEKPRISAGVINFINKYKPKFHITVTDTYFGQIKVGQIDAYFLPAYVFGLLV